MQPLLNRPKGVASFSYGCWRIKCELTGYGKCNSDLEGFGLPIDDKGGKQRLISARGDAEKVNYRYLMFAGLSKPLVVSGIWILSHERIVDNIIPFIDLPMNIPLIVVPNFASRFREYCFDR